MSLDTMNQEQHYAMSKVSEAAQIINLAAEELPAMRNKLIVIPF